MIVRRLPLLRVAVSFPSNLSVFPLRTMQAVIPSRDAKPLCDSSQGVTVVMWHAGKGLYGIYPEDDSTFDLICKNVDYLDAKSGQPQQPCSPKPAPPFDANACRSTLVNGLPGTGCVHPSCILALDLQAP